LNGTDITPGLALHAGIDVPLTSTAALTARYSIYALGSVGFTTLGIDFTKEPSIDQVISVGFRLYR
jgi:hypothetical protein